MRTKPDAHEYAIASTLEQVACVNVSLHAAYHANGRIDCVAVAETDRGDEIASVARGNFIDASKVFGGDGSAVFRLCIDATGTHAAVFPL